LTTTRSAVGPPPPLGRDGEAVGDRLGVELAAADLGQVGDRARGGDAEPHDLLGEPIVDDVVKGAVVTRRRQGLDDSLVEVLLASDRAGGSRADDDRAALHVGVVARWSGRGG
jgi:hypothetical protein